MPITPACPLGVDQKRCEKCNGFGVKVEVDSQELGYYGEVLDPHLKLVCCSWCGGSGIVADGDPLVDPSQVAEKGHGID